MKDDCGSHVRKNWVAGIEEEVLRLKKEVSAQGDMIRTFGGLKFQVDQIRIQCHANSEEIAILREMVERLGARVENVGSSTV